MFVNLLNSITHCDTVICLNLGYNICILGKKKLIICFSGTFFYKIMQAGGFLFLIFLNEMLKNDVSE